MKMQKSDPMLFKMARSEIVKTCKLQVREILYTMLSGNMPFNGEYLDVLIK